MTAKKPMPLWQTPTGQKIAAYTKSEARAKLKQEKQVSRLPKGFRLSRVVG